MSIHCFPLSGGPLQGAKAEGVHVTMQHTWRLLRRMSLPPNESLRAQDQDTPQNRRRRKARQEQMKQVDPRHWVFVDESGETTEMTRRYGHAPRGERVREATPASNWSTLTLLGAMSEEGLLATMILESPSDGLNSLQLSTNHRA